MTALYVRNLFVRSSGEKMILKNVSLELYSGERVLLLGPNGSGKSSLIQTIMGNPKYEVVSGEIYLNSERITDLPTEDRVSRGLGVIFQMSPVIRGISLRDLLVKVSKRSGVSLEDVRAVADELNATHLLDRSLNQGFSGGEMKKAELLLLFAQNPKIALIDEIDSGVDVDSLNSVGKVFQRLFSDENRTLLIVTHTGHIARYVGVNTAYVMINGRIVCKGDPKRILETIFKEGFNKCLECVGVGDEAR